MVDLNKQNELEARLHELEQVIEALRNEDVDAIIGNDNILLLRLKEAEDQLRQQRDHLEQLVEERTAELEKAYAQLKYYGQRITQVQEEERKRIAFELHDDTAQYLSILKMQLNALINSRDIDNPRVIEKLKILEKDADRAFHDVRRFSHELRPSVLEHMGLQTALEQLAEDINKLQQIDVEVQAEGMEPDLTEEVKLGLFRIAQEALSNSRKHAQASKVIINLKFQPDRLRLEVSDNGSGFDVQEARNRAGKRGSLGLMSMQERATLIGADLNIESRLGQGAAVIAEVKL